MRWNRLQSPLSANNGRRGHAHLIFFEKIRFPCALHEAIQLNMFVARNLPPRRLIL